MANPVYWVGSNGNIYYGSGVQGAGVLNLGPTSANGGQFQVGSGGLYDVFTDSGKPNLIYSATQIADPNPGNTKVLADSTYGPSYSGGYSAPAVNLNQPYIDLINGALDALPGELNQAKSNVQKQFDVNNNELQSGFNQAQNNYQLQGTQNQQQFQTNKNQIQDQASQGLEGLMRLLGQKGAGGSSAALYAAPGAVADQAAMQNAGAANTYGQNQQLLDTNWNNYNTNFGQAKQKLNDWLTQQLQGAEQTSNSTEQSLREQLLGLQPSVAAAAPIVSQINSLRSQADGLHNFNPTYTGTTPTYTPPSISSYTASPTQIGQNQSATTPGTLTPALASLLGLNKDKQATNPFLGA